MHLFNLLFGSLTRGLGLLGLLLRRLQLPLKGSNLVIFIRQLPLKTLALRLPLLFEPPS